MLPLLWSVVAVVDCCLVLWLLLSVVLLFVGVVGVVVVRFCCLLFSLIGDAVVRLCWFCFSFLS